MSKLAMTDWSTFDFDTNGLALVARAVCRIAGLHGPSGQREKVWDITLGDGSAAPGAPITKADVYTQLQVLGIDSAPNHVEIAYRFGDCTANDSPYTPDAGFVTALTTLFDGIPE